MDPIDDEPLGADPPWQEDVDFPPRRRRMGAWIVACLLSLSLGLVGWAAEKRFHVIALVKDRLAQHGQVVVTTVPAAPAPDPRVPTLLTDGELALAQGRLDAAQGAFDKASVLTNRDPHVLLDEARVATAKAEVPWLRALVLPASAANEVRVNKALLDERVATAHQAADDALAVSPHDPSAILTKLDALRLAGDPADARNFVGGLTGPSGQAPAAEVAYALAALDLAQPPSPSVSMASVVDRLRQAADAEGGAGKARAALVVALAKAGDAAGAKAELGKLDALPHPYPVSPDLHAWLGVGAIAAAAPVPPAAPVAAAPLPAAAPAPPSPGVAASQPSTAIAPVAAVDSTVQAAQEAVRRGDYDRAERIYQALANLHPRDSQLLTSLANVRRVHNDPWGAIEAYQRAIEVNPSYLPAQMGLADTQWARGDRDGAAKTYKRIVDRFPESMYPSYVPQRAAP
jgi:tetratricopeptide (TPR) repeat protein